MKRQESAESEEASADYIKSQDVSEAMMHKHN